MAEEGTLPETPIESAAPEAPPEVVSEVQTTEAASATAEPAPTPAPEPVPNVEPPAATEQTPPAPSPVMPDQLSPPSPAATPANVAPSPSANIVQELLVKARARIQSRKQKKLQKIVEHISQSGKISNDEVEQLLRVSDSTATRYLLALAKEGRIKRIGSRGRAVFYSKI